MIGKKSGYDKKSKDLQGVIKVLFICHGNICRSTMAQSIFTFLVKQESVEEQFYIDSAATSYEEIGNPPHHGTVSELRKNNIPVMPHQATAMTRADYDKYDFIIGMDTANIRNINRICGGDPKGKIYKLMSFTKRGGDVADPWYTGDFAKTYEDVYEGCEKLLHFIREQGMI